MERGNVGLKCFVQIEDQVEESDKFWRRHLPWVLAISHNLPPKEGSGIFFLGGGGHVVFRGSGMGISHGKQSLNGRLRKIEIELIRKQQSLIKPNFPFFLRIRRSKLLQKPATQAAFRW